MNYLLTGAAGFIGSNFARELIKDSSNNQIIILDKLTYAANLQGINDLLSNPKIKFVHGDILNRSLVSELVDQVDFIVNFAAESHVDRSIESSETFFNTNIMGTVSLLETLRNFPSKVMLQISTDEVYGSITNGLATENYPLKPNSPYSSSKASADLICRSYFQTFRVDVRITRCTNNYGPFQNPEKLIPKIITNLLLGRDIPLYGDGKNVRDWIHVNDHISGILEVIKFGEAGGIYNIGSNNLVSNIEIARSILNLMGQTESVIKFVGDRPGHDFRYALDYSKIENKFGYTPKVNFSLGLSETINWYRESRDWWEPLLN